MTTIFHRLNPSFVPTSPRERLRASLGALTGIGLTGFISTWSLGHDVSLPLLIAPMGASAVLLFAAPASPLAQPWSIIGGNIVSALIGVICSRFISDPLIAASLAVALAIAAMLALHCLHPPSGAVALTAVLGGPAIHNAGFGFVLSPVALNSLAILAVALTYNNLSGHRYPHRYPKAAQSRIGTADPAPSTRVGAGVEDIEAALAEFDEVVNVSPDDLDLLFHKAQIRAFNRQARHLNCGQIMSRDVLTVGPDDRLEDAWKILIARHIRTLPVVDVKRVLQGIITRSDFLENSVLTNDGLLHLGFGRRFMARLKGETLPRKVADIMSRRVQSALAETPISLLVSPMVDQGIDHMPVVDAENRVIGIVGQSDLLVALFQSELDHVAALPGA